MTRNYRQVLAIENSNKKRWLAVNERLNDRSGIYILTRVDEDGIKYAYIGQAKHILTRLAQHMVGYQHIDLSLKKHGLYSKKSPYGWGVKCVECPMSELDSKEQHYIRLYAHEGYQLRNKTAGGQGDGKRQIDEYRPTKGYRDGIAQGRKTLAKELRSIIDKHLHVSIKEEKKHNKVSQNAYDKFFALLEGGDT